MRDVIKHRLGSPVTDNRVQVTPPRRRADIGGMQASCLRPRSVAGLAVPMRPNMPVQRVVRTPLVVENRVAIRFQVRRPPQWCTLSQWRCGSAAIAIGHFVSFDALVMAASTGTDVSPPVAAPHRHSPRSATDARRPHSTVWWPSIAVTAVRAARWSTWCARGLRGAQAAAAPPAAQAAAGRGSALLPCLTMRAANTVCHLQGWYDPLRKETNLNAPAIKKWLQVGAQPSDTVRSLLKKAYVIEPDTVKVEVPKVEL